MARLAVTATWLLVATMLLACGGGASPASSPGRPTPSLVRATDTPAPGPPLPTPTQARLRQSPAGAVTIGLVHQPTSLVAPPTLEARDGPAYSGRLVANLLLSQLVALDDAGLPTADLADSVPTLENGGARFVGEGEARQLRVELRLRANARWSDGQPVTFRDVQLSWELALNPHVGVTIETEHRIERIEPMDARGVAILFFSQRSARAAARRDPNRYDFLRDQRGPVLDPLYARGLPNSWIYPAHVIAPLLDGAPRTSPKAADLFTRSPYARQPIGSGPYRLVGWQPGVRLAFEARPDYVRGAPAVRSIHVVFGATAALQAGLRDGAIDLLVGDAALELVAPGVRRHVVSASAQEVVALNLDHPALANRAVRAAIEHGLDRTSLADSVRPPAADPAAASGRSPIVPVAPRSHSPVSTRTPDPAHAADLLDGAGWLLGPDGTRQRGGRRLALRLTIDDPDRNARADNIRAQLSRLGLDVAVERLPASALLRPISGRLARRDFDLALYADVDGADPLADLAARYGASAVPNRTHRAGDNVVGLRSARLDAVFAAAEGTLETATRARLLRDARAILDGELAVLPIFQHTRVALSSPELQHLRLSTQPIGETWNAWQWST